MTGLQMLNIDILSLENLVDIPVSDFKTNYGGASLPAEGRVVNSQNGYTLYYASNSTFKLENGTDIKSSDGFLITRDMFTEKGNKRQVVQPLAFWEVEGRFSQLSDSFKESVISGYNSTLQGSEVETTEEVFDEPILNTEGETYQEEQARLKEEKSDKEAQDLKDSQTSVAEENVIQEESITLKMEGASIQQSFIMKITELIRGTAQYPVTTYRISQSHKDRVVWTVSTSTLEDAEEAFSNRIQELTEDFNIKAEEDKKGVAANTPTLQKYENIEFYWIESEYSFQQMMTTESPDFDQMPLWRRELYRGPYSDAISFSNNGQTLNLDDFDTPRITAEGVMPNPSGGVGFTVRQNWKLTFTLETDYGSALSFMKSNAVEGIDISANQFDFTMYAGDRLEIDIDNEQESLGPFFISIKGQEWFSATEPDDEISLTLVKAEKLMVKYESGSAWILPDGSERTDIERVNATEYNVKAWNQGVETSKHMAELSENEEYSELRHSERERSSPVVKSESSFVSPEDIKEDISDATPDFFKWGNLKWWILGGTVVIGGFILLGLYVKGRASRAVVQTTPVQAPPSTGASQ